MRMYAHDYVWGVQDRRSQTPEPPGSALLDWILRAAHRRAEARRSRAAATDRPDARS